MSEQRPGDESIPDIQSTEHVTPSIVDLVTKSLSNETIPSSRGKKTLWTVVFFVVIILAAGGYYFISHANKSGSLSQIQGKVALSETELRNLVIANHLTVYSAGPLAGAKYTLTANIPEVAYVKYLPGDVGLNDAKTIFRAIGT